MFSCELIRLPHRHFYQTDSFLWKNAGFYFFFLEEIPSGLSRLHLARESQPGLCYSWD